MCNINIVFNKEKVNDRLMNHIINIMSHDSFQTNSHGQGILYFKKDKKDKVIYNLEKNNGELIILENAFLLASHQRLATSGLKDYYSNTQPLESDDFIIMHNGILSSLGDDEKSDTHHLLLKIQDAFTGEKDVIKIIQKLFPNITGSYSIVLYCKADGKLLYFKNYTPNFYITFNKHYFVASTVKDNVEFAQGILDIKREITEPKEGKVYDIINEFKEIAQFESYTYKSEDVSYGHSLHKIANNKNIDAALWEYSKGEELLLAAPDKPSIIKKDFRALVDDLNLMNRVEELLEGQPMSKDSDAYKKIEEFLKLQFDSRLININGDRVSMTIKKYNLQLLTEILSFIHVEAVYSKACHVIISLEELNTVADEALQTTEVSCLTASGDLKE